MHIYNILRNRFRFHFDIFCAYRSCNFYSDSKTRQKYSGRINDGKRYLGLGADNYRRPKKRNEILFTRAQNRGIR